MCHRKGEVWELQLKGSGKTPYSRYVELLLRLQLKCVHMIYPDLHLVIIIKSHSSIHPRSNFFHICL